MIPKTGTRELPPGVEDVRAMLTDNHLVELQEQVVTHGSMSINDRTLILALIAEIEDDRRAIRAAVRALVSLKPMLAVKLLREKEARR